MNRRDQAPRPPSVSVRLGPAAQMVVSDETQHLGRSRSAVVSELAEEGAKARLFPGIGFRGRPRRAWVIGSGLDVWEIVDLLRSYNGEAAKLRESHPLVDERRLRLARVYAEGFRDEVGGFLVANTRSLRDLRTVHPAFEVAE